MASIRQHRGKLLLDYRLLGARRRAYTQYEDNVANRALLEPIAQHVDRLIATRGDVDAYLVKIGLIAPEAPPSPVPSVAPMFAIKVAPAPPTLVSTPLFAEFAEQWFGEFKVGWRRTYVTTVRGILDKHLKPKLGRTEVGRVSRAQLLDLRTELSKISGRRAGTKLSPARINTIMLIVRQILSEAADRYEFTMPMGKLKPLKVPKSHVSPFTLDQAQLLITKIREDYKDYLTVRFFTAMRSGEIHGLKWKYVDFEKRLIYVREALVAGEDEYTKTDSSQRDIQMSQIVFDALKRQQARTAKIGEYVFCNRKGEPLDTNNFTKRVWYPLLRHVGLELRRPYQTRHTAATLWLAAGEAPEWIATQMGHASCELLYRTYSRFVPNLTRRDGSAVDRLLSNAFGGNKTESDPPAPPSQPPPARRDMPVALA
jgi:integrase